MRKFTIIGIFVLAVSLRLIYSLLAPTIVYNPDSSGYYGIGRQIFNAPTLKNIIQPFRTPLYPMFINTVFYVVGVGDAEEGTRAFEWGIQIVVALQLIIGAAAITIFIRELSRWIPSKKTLPLGIFLLFDVFVIGWERSIFTEGIAVSCVLITTTILFRTLLSPSKWNFISLWILCTLGFFLRPALITIPLTTLPILIWFFRKNQRALTTAIVTLVACMIVPIVYAGLNQVQFGYPGIQTVGDIDILGRILETKLPIENARKYSYFYETVKDYETKNLTTHPFRFLEYYDPDIYGKMNRFQELHGFNQAVLIHSFPLFFVYTIQNIPRVLLEINDYTRVPQHTAFVWVLQQFYSIMQYCTLLIPFLWIPMAVVWLKKPTPILTGIMLLGTMAMGQILLTSAIFYKEVGGQYQRLLLVIRPHMFLFLFLSLHQLLSAFTKHKKLRHTKR